MIPPAESGGRRREVNVREVSKGIFFLLSTGCQWQALPKGLPPNHEALQSVDCCRVRHSYSNKACCESNDPTKACEPRLSRRMSFNLLALCVT
jgi:transposase